MEPRRDTLHGGQLYAPVSVQSGGRVLRHLKLAER